MQEGVFKHKKNLGVLWVWEGSEVVFQGLMTSSCTYMVFTDKVYSITILTA
jgi:hypothetical protein